MLREGGEEDADMEDEDDNQDILFSKITNK